VTETQARAGTIVESRTPDQWAQLIRAELAQAAAGFVAAGQHLTEAKAQMRHGEWLPWVEREMPVSADTVQRLMAIAQNAALVKAANTERVRYLPPAWGTLYELSRLDPPLLEAAIDAGDIHAELERKRAAGLVVEYKKQAAIEAAKTVQPGQWWQLGEHLLYCGDSASDAFTSQVTGRFAFADPPYNAGKADWDHGFKWQHDYLTEAAGIVAVTPGISAIPEFLRATEMPYRWSMAAWITNGMTRGALGFGNWIYVALFAEAESIHQGIQDHLRISVSAAAASTRHESRKPAELLVDLIEAFTEAGDTVIDPFLGSGTTLFAAEQTGRKCTGAEIEPEFCAEIITRYQNHHDGEARPL
jgi:hypothetical protein